MQILTFQEEGIVQRQTIKGEANVRSVFLKDKTGEARVSLWNDISSTETPVSSYIEIVNVKVGNIYKGQVTFNSTARTEIKVYVIYLYFQDCSEI